ncbi:MAG: CheY-like chemotaxis protein [Phycisphaerales bacterium]|jgi:CheY-like chemotaxis protein
MRKDAIPSRSTGRPNTLGLRDRELTQLLGSLETASKSAPSNPIDREFSRWPFPSTSVPVTLIHPGGNEVGLRLACRNLSRGGVGLLHAAFVHPGSRLAIDLPRRTGGEQRIEGTVARCLHREGIIHEVGVQFDEPIAIRDFIRPDLFEGWLSYERIDPSQIEGSLIHVEPEPMDQKIVRHFLRETRVRIRSFATGAEALASARSGTDLILCEQTLNDMSGPEFIRALREQQNQSPVVLTASSPTPEATPEIRFSGANAFLTKPFDSAHLLLAVAEFLVGPASTSSDPGCLQSTPGPQLSGAYASKLREYADELDTLVADDRQIDAYVICVQIKGTAPTLGFRAIGDRAGWLATQISTGVKLGQIKAQVSELTEACRKLRAA